MEWAVWVGFSLVVIWAVVGIFYWGGFLRGAPMTRTRGGMWFFAFICLTAAIDRLLMLRATLWPQLGTWDWFMLSVLLVLPILALWRHLRYVREMTEEVSTTGFQLVIGGYLPLWFGFTMVERMSGR